MLANSRPAIPALSVLALAAAFVAAPAHANPPVIELVSPAPDSTVFIAAFPAVVPVTFTIAHDPLDSVNVLKVVSAGTTVPSDTSGNPFSSFGCTTQWMFHGYTSCAFSGTVGALGFHWGIPAPGQYTLQISAKHRGDTGEEEEVVTFQLVNVEYPAPPSVANKYINTYYRGMKSGVRGCIISAIAELHAHDSAYGPKGGPYNEAAIRQDVDAFKLDCGG